MNIRTKFSTMNAALRDIQTHEVIGRATSVTGLDLTCSGLNGAAGIGSQVIVNDKIRGEVVGMNAGGLRILPFGSWEGVNYGAEVRLLNSDTSIRPDMSWIGRVVDAFGRPLDNKPLPDGNKTYLLRTNPPDAFDRRPVGEKLETGIKALDVFIPLCRGQRIGLFAGSGVGKSTTIAMLARQVNADVIVMGLIGERGKEVQDFIGRELGDEGIARSVLVVSTSDQPSLTRRQAAWTATAIAEYFRDQGLHVMLMLDSVTRFAQAQREIGLAANEPPAMRAYTPSVFQELPKLLERSGPGNPAKGQGDITAVYTVLVDGDDMNDPIADAVRGILDGHAILDRKIAERGRYPAINILKSISRMLPHCHTTAEREIMLAARRALAKHGDIEDLVSMGAYRRGSDHDSDMALAVFPEIDGFLRQGTHDVESSEMAFANLYGLLAGAGYEITIA